MQDKNYRIYPNVVLGKEAIIGDYVIVGEHSVKPGQKPAPTKIGNNATIRSHTVIYHGNKIGHHFMTGHGVLLREHNDIGNNVSIGSHSLIEHHIIIGNNVRIHSNVFIPEYSVVEENAWIGPCVTFTNALHPQCPQVKHCLKGPHIKRGAKVGANVTILPHITIGENALIGAGTVVTEDVPDSMVVIGNPSRIIKDVKDLNCPFDFIDGPYQLED